MDVEQQATHEPRWLCEHTSHAKARIAGTSGLIGIPTERRPPLILPWQEQP